jgi:hypothetical protein
MSEAAAKIKELLDKAHDAIHEAEKIADESGVDFSFNVSWGMGGRYYPNPANAKNWPEEPDYPYEEKDDGTGYGFTSHYQDYGAEDNEGFWYSSSMSC